MNLGLHSLFSTKATFMAAFVTLDQKNQLFNFKNLYQDILILKISASF